MEIKIIKKKMKNIILRINNDCELIVSAPKHITNKYLTLFIEEKKSWITKNLQKCQKNKIDKNCFYYLGKKYKLNIIKSEFSNIVFEDEICHLYLNEDKDKFIDKWYKQQAQKLYLEILQKYQPIVNKPINRVSIKKMKTRWGSCNYSKGYINLNLSLMKNPIEAIEYVVLHELTHLIYPNHSKDFHSYIENIMPDFRERKSKLLVM